MTKMDLKKLLGLRPKGNDLAAMEAALAQASEAGETARRKVEELTALRVSVLLDGSEAEVEAAEKHLAQARAEGERLAVILPGLEARIADAQRVAKVARVHDLIGEANAKQAAAEAAIRDRYPALAAALVREVLAPEREALRALAIARAAIEEAMLSRLMDGSEAAKLRPLPMVAACADGSEGWRRHSLGAETLLPSTTGLGAPYDSGSPIWPVPTA